MKKERLINSLREKGNPYGLILESRKISTRLSQGEDGFSGPLESSSSLLCLDSSGSLELDDGFKTGLISSMVGMISSSSMGNIFSVDEDTIKTGMIVLPQLALMGGNIAFQEQDIKITKQQIVVGSVLVKKVQFKGDEQFLVKNKEGDIVDKVDPGQSLLMVHVNRKRGEYGKMEPGKRVKAFKKDFENLCLLINEPEKFELAEDKVSFIRELQETPMLGVSHLAKLVNRKVLIWGIEELPSIYQKFHRLDSQLTSKAYGGTRRVDINDVGVVYITSERRRAIGDARVSNLN
jgi:hypothetical protein